MADNFDILATTLKLAKGKVEEAQYVAEQCRSELIAVRRAAKVCEGHDATIAELKSRLAMFEVSYKELNKENEKLSNKLRSITSLLGKESV